MFTFILENLTIAIPTKTAIKEPGTLFKYFIFGHTINIARLITPIKTAHQFTVEKLEKNASNFSTVSIGAFSANSPLYFTPKKSLNCPIKIVTAIPAVKPVVMVYGINFINEPNLKIPIKISKIPAIIVASTSPSIPFAATTPATIVANAAVGPAI